MTYKLVITSGSGPSRKVESKEYWMTQVGMAAADHLPFGSRVTLPDGTVVVIRDRMGGNYTDKLDLFKETEDECWKFGRQILRCRVEIP